MEWWSVLAVGIVLLALAIDLSPRIVSDTFFVLNGGRFVADHGLPHHDTLTVVAYGREWIDQQWLAQLAFYGADRVGGLLAVALLATIATTLTVALLLVAVRRAGLAALRTTILGVVALVEVFPYATARSQVLVLPLFVVLLVLLDRARERPRLAWWSLAVLVVWANLHGSVLVGIGLVVAWVAGELWGDRRGAAPPRWRLLGLAAAAVATLAATPYGLSGLSYYGRVSGNRAFGDIISEWEPASLGEPLHWPFFALLLVTLPVIGANRRRLAPFHWLVVLGLAVAALWSIRFGIFFGLAALYVLGLLWARVPIEERPAPVWLVPLCGLLAAGTLGLVIAAIAGGNERLVRRTTMPVAALPFLDRFEQRPGARILADDQTSNYVLWTHPGLAHRVSFDSRLELLKERELRAFARFLGAAAEWPRYAAGYDAIILDPRTHTHIADALRHARAWRVVIDRDDVLVAERRAA